MKIPQISIPNNSLIFMSGLGSLDNIPGSQINGQKNVVIPNSYKIKIRQLLPLPRKDKVNNDENLFVKEGYIDTPDNEIYNKFVDYINNSIKKDKIKDLSLDYIVDRIFRIGESRYVTSNHLGNDQFQHMEKNTSKNDISRSASTFYKSDLDRSYINNHGFNIKYDKQKGFNGNETGIITDSQTGYEYFGQSVINGYKNMKTHNEYDTGNTNPKEAEEGTIRKRYGISIDKNSVKGYDSFENAKIEIEFIFKD